MDPDFIREQAKNVWRVLATNAKVIQDRNLTIEGAFVGADFVQNQASVLFDAVADSVNLRANHARDHQFYILKPEFLSHQGSALKAVLDDSARLQDTSQTTFSGLSSLNDEFILDVVSQLHAIVDGNTSIAMQYQVQPNTLYMSHPSFIARLMLAFHSVMSSYVQNRKGMIVQQQRIIAVECALVELKAQAKSLAADKAAALAKVAEWEASMTAPPEQLEQPQKSEAADAARARIRQLEEELTSLKDQQMLCSSAERSVAELSALKLEHEKLVQAYEEKRKVASHATRRLEALRDQKREVERERDALAAEASRAHKAHETSIQTQAQAHERMNAEILRLEEIAKQKDSAAKELKEETLQLKTELEASKKALLHAQNQLEATVIQCDTWKDAAKERENTEILLRNAELRIQLLELQLQEMIDEDSKRRAGTAQKALSSAAAIPSQPIAVQLPPLSSARKRSATAREGVNAISSAANASPSVNWAAHGSPLPPSRAKELAALPAIFVDLGPGQAAPAIFTRQSLSAILGGCGQGLIVRCTDSASQLARNHNISCFLCPNMDHNPWSPSGPGKHGYMQVGLGRDKDLFNDGEYRHVFVGAGKHLIYCGWYHALRVERLTKEEWTTLPQKVQTAYATTTVNKEKSMELKSRHHALAMYNTGKLRAPCVRLQCVGFDTAFYQQLVRANDQYFMLANASGGSSAKRRRVSQADAQEDDSEEDVRRPAAVPSAKRAVPQVVNITPPASASAPQNGEVVVKQAIATDARLAPTPSVKRVGSSSQVPSHPPVGPRRPSTRTASGTLTLRGPGF